MRQLGFRRFAPRISVHGLCGVVGHKRLDHATLVELSALGLRVERPFDPRSASRIVQLEIELPGVDEIVWARGDVAHAYLTPMGGRHANGDPRFWCRAGIRIAGVSCRERRLLRDYVIEMRRARRPSTGLAPLAELVEERRAGL